MAINDILVMKFFNNFFFSTDIQFFAFDDIFLQRNPMLVLYMLSLCLSVRLSICHKLALYQYG